jgi:hypothetical protein
MVVPAFAGTGTGKNVGSAYVIDGQAWDALARIHRSSRCRGQLMAEARLRATERDRRDAWVPA